MSLRGRNTLTALRAFTSRDVPGYRSLTSGRLIILCKIRKSMTVLFRSEIFNYAIIVASSVAASLPEFVISYSGVGLGREMREKWNLLLCRSRSQENLKFGHFATYLFRDGKEINREAWSRCLGAHFMSSKKSFFRINKTLAKNTRLYWRFRIVCARPH